MLIEVLACNGGMEARLSLREFDPGQWRSRFPEKAGFIEFLTSKGLDRESVEPAAVETAFSLLTEAALDEGSAALNLQAVQSLVLASGTPPVHEEAEGLMFHKSYLADPGEIKEVEKRLAEGGPGEADSNAPPGCRVEAGQVILSLLAVKPGKPGRDVFGKEIPCNPYTGSLPAAGRGIFKLDRKWVAGGPGVLVLRKDTLMVLGGPGTEPGLIRVSEDKLHAWLMLKQDTGPCDDDEERALEAVRNSMAKLRLRPIKDEAAVRRALVAFLLDGIEQDVLLVEGVAPKPGRDGEVQLLVDPEPDLPDPESTSNVDFKAFTFFRSVRKGEKLARIHPPQPGVAGMDVFGEITLPRPGSPVQVIPGRNTDFAPGDPALIVATRDGRLSVEGGIPCVVDTLKVDQDVSFKTGNLNFPGSVEVAGNVLDKFSIEAKGDVGIGGVVENGVVISEGAILIKGGAIGGGSGLIKSKLSSVTIGFIRNQRIESHSNIVVYNEVLNSELLARKSVLMKSGGHAVIGGHLTAFESIEIGDSGNEAGTKTLLEVGKDFEVEAEAIRKREYLKSVRADLDFLEKKHAKLDLIMRWDPVKKVEDRLLEQRVKGVLSVLERLRTVLNAKLNELEAAIYNPGPCHITVSGTAYPGTVLKFRDRVIPITEPVTGKRWLFKGG